jgi:hypothetical protein
VNGKIETYRRWWYGLQIGSIAPADEILDCNGATITPGVVEMACRVNVSATSFVKAAAILDRTAQVKLSGERLRQEVDVIVVFDSAFDAEVIHRECRRRGFHAVFPIDPNRVLARTADQAAAWVSGV